MAKMVSDPRAGSTRAYRWSLAAVTAVSGTSTGAAGFAALSESPVVEVMFETDVACFVSLGKSDVSAASSSSVLRLSAGERFHFRLDNDATHWRAIASSTSGTLRVTAVA